MVASPGPRKEKAATSCRRQSHQSWSTTLSPRPLARRSSTSTPRTGRSSSSLWATIPRASVLNPLAALRCGQHDEGMAAIDTRRCERHTLASTAVVVDLAEVSRANTVRYDECPRVRRPVAGPGDMLFAEEPWVLQAARGRLPRSLSCSTCCFVRPSTRGPSPGQRRSGRSARSTKPSASARGATRRVTGRAGPLFRGLLDLLGGRHTSVEATWRATTGSV